MEITLGQQYNVGEKPNVILSPDINRHARTPETQSKQNRGNVVHRQTWYYRNGKTLLFYTTPIGYFIQYCSVRISLYVLDLDYDTAG